MSCCRARACQTPTMRRLLVIALLVVAAPACSGARSPDDQAQLRRTILDVSGHVIAMKSAGAFVEYGEVVDAARAIDPTLVAAEPFMFLEATVSRQERSHGIAVKGMVPDTTLTHDLERYLVKGRMFTAAAPSLEALDVVIGDQVARTLGVDVGDSITLEIPLEPNSLERPRPWTLRVAGILHFGNEEYDLRLVFAPMSLTQRMVDVGDQVMGVTFKLTEPRAAKPFADKLQRRLGEAYVVMDWCSLNRADLGC
jgi:ABC-type lipoprotein release transport system permease subunit